LQRAAHRARELAARTGTALVVTRQGVIEHIQFQPATAPLSVQEEALPYGNDRGMA